MIKHYGDRFDTAYTAIFLISPTVSSEVSVVLWEESCSVVSSPAKTPPQTALPSSKVKLLQQWHPPGHPTTGKLRAGMPAY